MISPESGIHRPSYNGAPAKQTMSDCYLAEIDFSPATVVRFNVCGATAASLKRRVQKAD